MPNPYHVKSGVNGGQFTTGGGGGDLNKTEKAARVAAGVEDKNANTKGIVVGDQVEFINPTADELMPDGSQPKMKVKELRGSRLLVETPMQGMSITPTKNVDVKDVQKVKTKKK